MGFARLARVRFIGVNDLAIVVLRRLGDETASETTVCLRVQAARGARSEPTPKPDHHILGTKAREHGIPLLRPSRTA